MTNPLISIIIPVYKVEQYFAQCVDSVLGQSYHNVEIILVDDGSPDSCPAICDDYAKKDNRVKVIHKTNGGLSDARNAGKKVATGDYVIFLDSDDYWSDVNALACLGSVVNNNKEVDVIYFRRFAFNDENGAEVYQYPPFDLEKVNNQVKHQALKYLITNNLFIPSACNKIVKRKILEEIEYEKGLLSEDIDWNFAVTLKANHFFVVNDLFYAYRIRQGSITQTVGLKNIEDLISIIEKWSVLLQSQCADKEIRYLLFSYCAYQYSIVLGLIFRFVKNKSKREELFQRVKKMNFLFDYDGVGKVKKVKRIYKITGLKNTAKFLAFYLKHRNR
jgi:glycosyltransferase involved in cell wall biosynthesis